MAKGWKQCSTEFENATAKVCKCHGKRFKTPRQKFENITAKVSKRHGKSLKTPRQKFENATAKVSKCHGKSLKMPRQKFQNITAKAFPRRKWNCRTEVNMSRASPNLVQVNQNGEQGRSCRKGSDSRLFQQGVYSWWNTCTFREIPWHSNEYCNVEKTNERIRKGI